MYCSFDTVFCLNCVLDFSQFLEESLTVSLSSIASIIFQTKSRTTLICVVTSFGFCFSCEKKTMIRWRNVWSVKWRVPGQEIDQRKLGERSWKKTVEHVDWIRRIPWIVVEEKADRDDWWPRWVLVGECFFWYRLTRVVPDIFHRAVKRLGVLLC